MVPLRLCALSLMVAIALMSSGGAVAAPTPPGGAVPVGSLLAPGFTFAVAVFHLPRPTASPKATLARLARAHGLRLVNGTTKGPREPVVWLRTPPVAEYQPPGPEFLKHFGRGLSEEQRRALVGTKAVSVLVFEGPGDRALPTYRIALALAGAFAKACGGLIWDQEARLLHAPTAWAKLIEGWSADGLPDIKDHLAVHIYRDGELIRMITLGMAKFALPDVVVNQVPNSASSMKGVTELVGHRLVEGARIEKAGQLTLVVDQLKHRGVRDAIVKTYLPGARGRATFHLAFAKPEEGDPENRLIEMVFPGPPGKVQERQIALLDELYGSKDAITHIQHDAALLAASARAKKKVLGYKPRYRQGPPENEHLLVKAPFKTPEGGQEWMWVEVIRWEGKKITGILDNDPFEIPTLKAGARVVVDEDSLFDYTLTRPDGSEEGNETGAIIEKQQSQK